MLPKRIVATAAVLASCGVGSTHAAIVTYTDHASFLAAAGAGLKVIDFDSTPVGAITGTEFASDGLVISAVSGNPLGVRTGGGSWQNSAPNVLTSSLLGGFTNSDADDIDFDVAAGATAFGIWVGNIDKTTTINWIDDGGTPVATQAVSLSTPGIIANGTSNNRVFVGAVATAGERLSRLEVRNAANDGDGIALDDVQFALLPKAEANGPYLYDASGASPPISAAGSAIGAGTGPLTYSWTTPNAVVTGETPTIDLIDSGIANTVDTASWTLTVDDGLNTAMDSVIAAYGNTDVVLDGATAILASDGALSLSLDVTDPDVGLNALLPNFERLSYEVFVNSHSILADSYSGSLESLTVELTHAQVDSFFPSPGDYSITVQIWDLDTPLNAFDDSFSFIFAKPVPIPSSVLTMALALGLAALRRYPARSELGR